ALAWRPWPPIYKPRPLLASMNIPVLRSVEAITPHGAMLFALTVYRDDYKLMPLTTAALTAGADDWRAELKEEAELASLRAELEKVPKGRIAVLPTDPGGPCARFAQRCGVLAAAEHLTPQQLVEPNRFVARRYPVALHLGGEHYPFSVHKTGDGADALLNYLASGGLIVCAGREPLPFCYGDDLRQPDGTPGPSLWPRLGLPMENKFEQPASGRTMRIEHIPSQRVLWNLPWQLAFPSAGDLRLRSINGDAAENRQLRYQPIYSVVDDLHNELGDVVASVEWRDGRLAGGRLLYVWSGLLQDPETATPLFQSVFRFVIEQARRAQ
ncbi:MAG: hypothetical protein N2689_16135, partial [Verrucomicrobiae bacterium]|nr:hypothetical protein [Verrucomicrobiae bacterium]